MSDGGECYRGRGMQSTAGGMVGALLNWVVQGEPVVMVSLESSLLEGKGGKHEDMGEKHSRQRE